MCECILLLLFFIFFHYFGVFKKKIVITYICPKGIKVFYLIIIVDWTFVECSREGHIYCCTAWRLYERTEETVEEAQKLQRSVNEVLGQRKCGLKLCITIKCRHGLFDINFTYWICNTSLYLKVYSCWTWKWYFIKSMYSKWGHEIQTKAFVIVHPKVYIIGRSSKVYCTSNETL